MAFEIVTGAEMAILSGADPRLASLLNAASGQVAPGLTIAGQQGNALPESVRNAILARQLGQTAAVVSPDVPTKARRYVLGFDSGGALIPALGTVAVINRPQVAFKSERLIVPSDIAGGFVVNDVVVGKNSQFASNAVAVPARGFDERAEGMMLAMDTAQISQDVIINVTNIGGAPARFRALIAGPAVE